MDTAAIIMEGRTLLPIKYIAEPMGASVDWNSKEGKITIELEDNYIEIWLDKNVARVNGERKPIDDNNINVKPVIIPPGRTMLPLKFIAENLGCQVEWNSKIQEVRVISSEE
ncbi:hypothetical protein TZ02_17225 [Clostridium aceticum]|nr:hypothetical protein TZ02_17225 [Clostridium aceticum]